MLRRIQGFLLTAIAVVLLPASALASHYEIGSAGIVDDQVAEKLATNGISSTKDLWSRTASRSDRAKLAKKLKVKPAEVARWHDFCDLLRLSGVGPKVARVMTAAGVHNLRELVRANPDDLAARIAAVHASVPELGKLPDRENLQSWIDQAAEILKQDAPPKKKGRK